MQINITSLFNSIIKAISMYNGTLMLSKYLSGFKTFLTPELTKGTVPAEQHLKIFLPYLF